MHIHTHPYTNIHTSTHIHTHKHIHIHTIHTHTHTHRPGGLYKCVLDDDGQSGSWAQVAVAEDSLGTPSARNCHGGLLFDKQLIVFGCGPAQMCAGAYLDRYIHYTDKCMIYIYIYI
jgi:hypothetical protein